MAKVTIKEAGQACYLALHEILLQAEAGKPMTEELLAKCQAASYLGDKVRELRNKVYADSADDREPSVKPVLVNDQAEAIAAVGKAHDALSDALENPDADNDEVREAAIEVCSALNALYDKANYPDSAFEEVADGKLTVLDDAGRGKEINVPTVDDVARHIGGQMLDAGGIGNDPLVTATTNSSNS